MNSRKFGRDALFSKPRVPRQVRAIGVLTGGSAVAQLLPVLVSPILTRLFSPREFGLFATFVAVTMVIGVAATARFEQAIVLPESDEEAQAVRQLCSCVLLGSVCLTAAGALTIYFGAPDQHLGLWVLGVPITVGLVGLNHTLSFVCNRYEAFTKIATSSVNRSTTMSLVQLGGGSVHLGPSALIAGHAAGFATSTFAMRSYNKVTAVKATRSQMARAARRYRDFPIYSLPATLANSMSTHGLPILIGSVFAAPVVGQYALLQRVLGAPTALVGDALGRVFMTELIKSRRRGDSRKTFNRTLVGLVGLSLVPFVLVASIGPSLFSFVFGSEWREAGQFAQLMVPLFWLRFIAAPLSTTVIVFERQRWFLGWQVALFIITFGNFGLAHMLSWNPSTALLSLALISGLHYVLLLFATRRFAHGPNA